MGKILVAEQAYPSTPSSGNAGLWVDNVVPAIFVVDDAGRKYGRSWRAATAAQGAGFSSDTYLTSSGILIPSFGVQAQTVFRWDISASKTAAGTAQPVYTIRIGANQSTADTSRLALTGPAQTAAADVGILTIIVTMRNVGAAGVPAGTACWAHNLGTATGFGGSVEGTGAAFDNSALNGQYIGLSINGGASAAWTVTQVVAEAIW